MAEVTGIVLGAIPIAIWALEKYAAPYEVYTKYHLEIETLRADLILQRRQLENTLASVGLINPTNIDLQECFERKFPSIQAELILIIERMNTSSTRLLQDLNISLTGKPQWTDDPPERAQWEWRKVKGCFTSKKRKALIEDLRNWNDLLRNNLEQTEIATEDETPQVQALIKKFNRRHCDSIRSCLRSFHRALECALNCNCVSPHRATLDLDWNSGSTSTPWVFTTGLSYARHPASPRPSHSWRTFRVTAETDETIELQQNVPPAPISTAQTPPTPPAERSRVSRLINSFRQPNQTVATITPPPVPVVVPPPRPANSIASLCAEVQKTCSPWSISGCLQVPDGTAGCHYPSFTLHDAPTELSCIARTISLRHLLSRQNIQSDHAHLALSAKQRYGIAASVAWSVLYLSDSPWLTERWDQNEISFFVEEGSEGLRLLSKYPCASYAFKQTSITNQIRSSGMRDIETLIPNKIVFTLGVILIELCLKVSFEELQQRFNNQVNGNEISGTLLDTYRVALDSLDDVYREAGDSYGNAVQRCVKSFFPGPGATKSFDVEYFRIQFYNTVVAPVQATYSMMPGSGSFIA